MKVLTTRIDNKLISDLKKIEKEEKAERAEVVRRLLSQGVKNWKMQKALKKFSDGAWTIRKTAKFAEVTYYEMIEEMTKQEVSSGPLLTDLRE